MFLKKLITNLCIFPARSTSSSSSSSNTHSKNKPPSSFATHLSRHLYTQHQPPVHIYDHNQYSDKKLKQNNFNINTTTTVLLLDTSTAASNDEDHSNEDVFFTSSSNHSDHLISHNHHGHHYNNQQQSAADFATAFASQRFFFSSPGHSKSLISGDPFLQATGGTPVPKYSPDPYLDFRKSMQEMVDARSIKKDNVDDVDHENWEEYLHQLLTCYLTLNPINTHEYIINAFSDLLVNFLLNDKQNDINRSVISSAKRRARIVQAPFRGSSCE